MPRPRQAVKHNQALGLRAPAFALITALATGCSGINASKSISLLDFILPRFIQNCPASPVIPVQSNAIHLLAQASPVPL